jgi:hypothetical protein
MAGAEVVRYPYLSSFMASAGNGECCLALPIEDPHPLIDLSGQKHAAVDTQQVVVT